MSQPPPPNPLPFMALPGPTIRASQSAVTFDGGSFQLVLGEQRPAFGPAGPRIEALAEVGRFSLPPAALYWLRMNIENAIKAYESMMGHPLPDPTKFMANAIDSQTNDLLSPPPPKD